MQQQTAVASHILLFSFNQWGKISWCFFILFLMWCEITNSVSCSCQSAIYFIWTIKFTSLSIVMMEMIPSLKVVGGQAFSSMDLEVSAILHHRISWFEAIKFDIIENNSDGILQLFQSQWSMVGELWSQCLLPSSMNFFIWKGRLHFTSKLKIFPGMTYDHRIVFVTTDIYYIIIKKRFSRLWTWKILGEKSWK